MISAQFDPSLEDFPEHRYAHYRFFRERDPVHGQRARLPAESSTWYVFRHEDVAGCLKDKRFTRRLPEDISREPGCVPRGARPILDSMSKWMLFQDPPDHTRLRSLVNRSFTSRLVTEIRPRIEAIATELLGQIGEPAEFDVVATYAFPLPIIVIAEILGVPPSDRQYFRSWSVDIVSAADGPTTSESLARASTAVVCMELYLGEIISHRRCHPSTDLISNLLKNEGEGGGRTTAAEVVAMCVMLLSAGFETTGNLISNGLLALLRHPSEMEKARRNPALLASGVEELARYDSPVQATTRYASEDVAIGGKLIHRGDTLVLVIGSANRDERQFEDPDRLDLARSVSQHLSFGMGIHFCLGYSLARMEGTIAISRLLDRYPLLQLGDDTPEWKPGLSFAGLRQLMIIPCATPARSHR